MRNRFFLLMLVTGFLTSAQGAGRFVDLNKPGAMDQLKRDNPAHYSAVRGIVDHVFDRPEGMVEKWIRVTYKAEDVGYSPILLASDPPKRSLSFRLDDVRYRTLLTLPREAAVAEPAVRGERPR